MNQFIAPNIKTLKKISFYPDSDRINNIKSTLWVLVTLSLGKLHIIKIKYVPSLLQLVKNKFNSFNK